MRCLRRFTGLLGKQESSVESSIFQDSRFNNIKVKGKQEIYTYENQQPVLSSNMKKTKNMMFGLESYQMIIGLTNLSTGREYELYNHV